jgi:DNA-binding NarL/FixJ family response regulator
VSKGVARVRWIVLIVDDHPLVGQAFELSIRAAYPHLDVGRVTSAAEADDYAKRYGTRIKLVMLDLMLPDAEGFSALLRLQHLLPEAAIAIVSARADAHSISMARAFGVQAYLSKSDPVEKLVNAVGAVMRGETLFPEEAKADPVVVDFHRKLSSLSGAQMRVMRALVDGKLNKQIAGEMNLTEGTVKQHVSAILRKLEVNNRSQAILAAAPVLRNDQVG